jgi:cytochrome c peroxidase
MRHFSTYSDTWMTIRHLASVVLCAALGLGLTGCRPPADYQLDGSNDTVDAEIEESVPDAPTPPAASAAVTPAVAQPESLAPTSEPAPAEPAVEEPAAAATVAEATANVSERVVLGDSSLTAGIPGEGPLQLGEIEAWLANPTNHQVLDVELPFGLSAAAAQIKGLDTNPLTRAKIELGRQLYFDTRLSSDNTISCASCHHPDEGYGRATQFGVGVQGQTGNRNSPVSYNRIVSGAQFWDGRADSLEAQAIGPIANPIEMGNTHDVCVKSLGDIPGYQLQFAKIFPDDGLTIENVGKAIAAFERTLVSGPAPYDYYEIVRTVQQSFSEDEIATLEEDDPELFAKYQEALEKSKPMSESARRGRELFFTEKANCTACHAGANFTDENYHNLGVGMDAAEPDLGRFVVTQEEKDKGAFKTPTIRNITKSAPYMHDGSQKTLEEVVEWYAKGGHPNPHLSEKMKKLDLSDQDKADLVAFMVEGLTSDFPPVATERLPADK